MAYDESIIRIKMIAALESGDDAALAAALKEDRFLDAYYSVLHREAERGALTLLKKMLEHPAVDKSSNAYQQAVSNVFGYLGANYDSPDTAVLTVLLESMKNSQASKDGALRFIFGTVAQHNIPCGPSVEAARMLVENGAKLEESSLCEEWRLQSEINYAQARMARLLEFKNKIKPI